MVHVLVGKRVAPLVPLRDGERQRRIQDRRQRVDERAPAPGCPRRVPAPCWPPHPSAGRPRYRRAPPWCSARVTSVAMRCFATAMKSVKVFFFSKQLAVLVPRPAQLAATAHVGDDEDHAAVQQRQPGDREARILTGLVGAVAVQQRRRWKLQARTMNDGDRDARTVRRLRPSRGARRTPRDGSRRAPAVRAAACAPRSPGRCRRCAPGPRTTSCPPAAAAMTSWGWPTSRTTSARSRR